MENGLNILFVCTSNKDRSIALEEFFKDNHPQHTYRSAGVNRYFTEKKGTHYLTMDDLEWCDIIVCAEDIHVHIINRDFGADYQLKNNKWLYVLNLGEYKQGQIGEDYLVKAEMILLPNITHIIEKKLKSLPK